MNKMKCSMSHDVLVVENAWMEQEDRRRFSGSAPLENVFLLEVKGKNKEQDDQFVEKVHNKIKTQGLSKQKAMDEARVDLILEACNGDAEICAISLLTEWNYEPQINRFLDILYLRGLYTSLESYNDHHGNSALHLVAAKGHACVAQFLIAKYPQMVMRTNLQSELPIETALRCCHDDVAAFLIRKMSHNSVLELFRVSKKEKARNNFVEIVRKFKMKKTILAILDAMIIPKWPYPASLHYHNTLIGDWQDIEDHPTHFEICYELLDADQDGRNPLHPEYQYCPKTAFYYIMRQCQKDLQKELLLHPVLRFLSGRKWVKYARFWFRVRFVNYFLFIMILTSAMLGLVSERDGSPTGSRDVGVFSSDPVNNICFMWCMLMSLWFLLDEVFEFRREPKQYLRDWTNWWDIARNVMLIYTLFIRFSTDKSGFWFVASIATFMNAMGIFKYQIVFSFSSSYTRTFGRVIFKDMPRFTSVFMIVVFSFVISIIISLRSEHPKLNVQELVRQSGFGFSQHLNGTCSELKGNTCILLSILKVWALGSPLLENTYEFIGPFTSVLVCLLSLTVTVILFNVLIAQLSHTYQTVQEDSHLSSFVELMHAICTVEFQSRFKYWQVRVKYFATKEVKTTDEMKEYMQAYKHALGEETPNDLETRLSRMETMLNQLKEKKDGALENKRNVK